MTGKRPARRRSGPIDPAGAAARRLALDVLARIESEGAYANLALAAALDDGRLEVRDRGLVTDLVYGTTRLRRSLDHLVDRHLTTDVSLRVRSALRIGAYQLGWTEVPDHAAVSATVDATPKPARGLVNAVLRRVAGDLAAGPSGVEWPDLGTELSYPDWMIRSLESRIGAVGAHAMLRSMNEPATTFVRGDGYVQDPASTAVVEAVAAGPGSVVLDLCAAPGGKATAIAASGAAVVAADLSVARAGLIVDNVRSTSSAATGTVAVVAADGASPPLAAERFDVVLVDAPCSGLGVLRRRADARWRVDAGAPDRLAVLQRTLVEAAAPLVAPGGRLVYSVCTLTEQENAGVADAVALPGFEALADRTLLADADHDAMYIHTWQRV